MHVGDTDDVGNTEEMGGTDMWEGRTMFAIRTILEGAYDVGRTEVFREHGQCQKHRRYKENWRCGKDGSSGGASLQAS